MNTSKKILNIGGTGQLGKAIAKCFQPYNITNIDFQECSLAKHNILLKSGAKAEENNLHAISELKKANVKFDSILVTAGGWAGGSIKDDDYLLKTQKMLDMNLSSNLLAAHLATKYLANNGLIIFTGAAAVFREPQPEMIGYALAKTGVHSLALNLCQYFLNNEHKGKVITILPEIIDTPSNRTEMPDADFKRWAKP